MQKYGGLGEVNSLYQPWMNTPSQNAYNLANQHPWQQRPPNKAAGLEDLVNMSMTSLNTQQVPQRPLE